MKKIFNSALLLGVALGLSSVTFAQDSNSQNSNPNAQQKAERKNKTDKRRDGRNGMMGGLNRLNLTDAQKQQIKDLRKNNQAVAANRNEMRELMQARRNGTLTAEQQNRFNTLREQGRVNAEQMHRQILAILTPEQRQQLEQMNQGRNDKRFDNVGDENRQGDRRAKNGEGRGGRFQGLNLTDAQKEQLRNLRANNNSNDTARQELRDLMQARRNGSLTAEQQNRLKVLREQTKADAEKREQQILSILTPEQRAQLEQNKAQRKERRGGGQRQNTPMDK
jgi:periplasmic protein CpxP/Spy